MRVIIEPSKINGEISSPASKSMLQRAIAAAFLTEEKVVINGYTSSTDADAVLDLVKSLGAEVKIVDDQIEITPLKNSFSTKLFIGESGLGIRLFAPILALFDKEFILNAGGTLQNRPMALVEKVLKANDVHCTTNKGQAPLHIKGPLKGGKLNFDASEGSQLLSGLLMALPKLKADSELVVSNLKSKPYIDMTISLLNDFGIEIGNENYCRFQIKGNQNYYAKSYNVEGDWSGAAFLLVAAAISGSVKLTNLNTKSFQGDKVIVDILKQVGSQIIQDEQSVFIKKNELKCFKFDATETPDLFPPLAALAACCNGISRIKGVHRLQFKESNRAEAILDIFKKIGLSIEIIGDEMIIEGGKPNGGIISSFHDHRMAMMAAVLGLVSKNPIVITESESIQKSYPGFYSDLRKLGAICRNLD